jgi:hypothetical protein
MRTLTLTAVVRPDHTLTAQVPADIPPGDRTVLLILDDASGVDQSRTPLRFSPHPVGPADPGCSYRREDIYGDDGR